MALFLFVFKSDLLTYKLLFKGETKFFRKPSDYITSTTIHMIYKKIHKNINKILYIDMKSIKKI